MSLQVELESKKTKTDYFVASLHHYYMSIVYIYTLERSVIYSAIFRWLCDSPGVSFRHMPSSLRCVHFHPRSRRRSRHPYLARKAQRVVCLGCTISRRLRQRKPRHWKGPPGLSPLLLSPAWRADHTSLFDEVVSKLGARPTVSAGGATRCTKSCRR